MPTKKELQKIWSDTKPWVFHRVFGEYLKGITESEESTSSSTRTNQQSKALFLWFSQIEEVCEQSGTTADLLFRHTSQVKITKEILHSMCKTLIKALYNKNSTKDINKLGELDEIQNHFIDLFANEGVELPPFPHAEQPTTLKNIELAKSIPYPENDLGETKI